MTDVRTTHTPDPNHPVKKTPKTVAKASDYTKTIVEVNGLWHAWAWSPEDEEEMSLGNFASEVLAERAVEDAIARHMYSVDGLAADAEARDEASAAEETRIKAVRDREVRAADVKDHKEAERKPSAAAKAEAQAAEKAQA